MRKDEAFPSNWIKADFFLDDKGRPRTAVLTISGVEDVEYRDGTKARALSFEETDKKLGLNRTNWEACEKITGQPDDGDWVGYKIECFRTMVEFQGKQTWGVRVRPVGGWETWSGPVAPGTEEEAVKDKLPF